ncbi:50S ribosomal protein L23 [Chlamydiota bacterium]
MKDPYAIIKSRYVTEKSTILEQLHSAQSNKSLKGCEAPKFVFVVDVKANKHEIASAVEMIYKEEKVKVTKVNTILMKPKPKRRGRGRPGATAAFKKAIVTMEPGDSIDKV